MTKRKSKSLGKASISCCFSARRLQGHVFCRCELANKKDEVTGVYHCILHR